jgi:Zn-dependent protease
MGLGAAGPLPSSGESELDRLRRTVSAHFPVYETRIGPQSVLFAVHIDRSALSEKFDGLRRELWTLGYIPILRRESGEDFVEVVRRPRTGKTRIWINLLLLAGTIATTTFAGAVIWLTYLGQNNLGFDDFANGALYFGVPVMTILGLHELAHYVMARRRHMDASLPYFVPVPPPFLFGTLGAFVSIREPFPDKKALFDIGAAGPLAGFVASIPIALAGLYLSAHAPVLPANYCGPTILGQSYGNLLIGTPLFWNLLALFAPSNLVSLHPLALAGWVGIFVTAINLLPAGQLDGGHVFRALFGDRTRYVSYAVVVLLFGLGIFYIGWWFFAILVLFLGLRHPPPLNDQTPLGAPRIAVGALVLAILVTGFVIVPIAVPPGAVSLNDPSAATSTSHAPGVEANLTVTVVNGDPVTHGYVFSMSVANVSVTGPNGTPIFLSGAALASWAANSSWSFYLPGRVVSLTGATPSLPASDYLTINGTASGKPTSYQLLVTFTNSETAVKAVIDMEVTQLCAASNSGTAGAEFSPQFP